MICSGKTHTRLLPSFVGHKGFALALNKAAFDQLFDNTGAGGGSAKPFLLSIIVELSVSRSLHRRQEGVFGVGLPAGMYSAR